MMTADGDVSDELSKLQKGYELLGELSRDEMVTVYVARDRLSGSEVAIKVLRANDGRGREALAHYASDARLLTALEHPNIVGVHSVKWLSENVVAVVTERVRGPTLRQVLDVAGTLPVARATEVLKGLGRALAWAHSSQIMHRDVRPENVIFEDGTGRVVLSDFGLARRIDVALGDAGADPYRAPELADGRYPDRRTDVFSLGIVGWELLTGRRPWPDTMDPIPPGQRAPAPPPLAAVRPGLPPALVSAIEGAVQLERDRRIADVGTFIDRLTGVIPPPPPEPEEEAEATFTVAPSEWVASPVPKLPSRQAAPTERTAGRLPDGEPERAVEGPVEREASRPPEIAAAAAAAAPLGEPARQRQPSEEVSAGRSQKDRPDAGLGEPARPRPTRDREVVRATERDADAKALPSAQQAPTAGTRSPEIRATAGADAAAMASPAAPAGGPGPRSSSADAKRRQGRRGEAPPLAAAPAPTAEPTTQPVVPTEAQRRSEATRTPTHTGSTGRADAAPPPTPAVSEPSQVTPPVEPAGLGPDGQPHARPEAARYEPSRVEPTRPGRSPVESPTRTDRTATEPAPIGDAKQAGARPETRPPDTLLPEPPHGKPVRPQPTRAARGEFAGPQREPARPDLLTPAIAAAAAAGAAGLAAAPTSPRATSQPPESSRPDAATPAPARPDAVRPDEPARDVTAAAPAPPESAAPADVRPTPITGPVQSPLRGPVLGPAFGPPVRGPIGGPPMRGGLGTPRSPWADARLSDPSRAEPLARPLDPVFDTPAELPLPVMPDPRPMPPDVGAGSGAALRSRWTRRRIGIAAAVVLVAGAAVAIATMERVPDTTAGLIEPETPAGYGGDVDVNLPPADSSALAAPTAGSDTNVSAGNARRSAGTRARAARPAPRAATPRNAPNSRQPEARPQPDARSDAPSAARASARTTPAPPATRASAAPARSSATTRAPAARTGATTSVPTRTGATTSAAARTPPARTRSPAVAPARTWDERAEGFARCNSPALADQRACISAHLARSDAGLNQIYNDVIAAMRRRANTAPGDPDPPEVQRLRAVQRNWIARRDAECRLRGRGREGPLWATQRAQCIEELSVARSKELSNTLARLRRD
ncbi:MAG: protein kinase [Gemmatimonadaceae bacterium]